MVKLFFIAIPISLAIGSGIGYRISEAEREAMRLKVYREDSAIAAEIAKPKPLSRDEMEQRFIACVGKPLRVKSFSDKDLNDSLAECESLKAKS